MLLSVRVQGNSGSFDASRNWLGHSRNNHLEVHSGLRMQIPVDSAKRNQRPHVCVRGGTDTPSALKVAYNGMLAVVVFMDCESWRQI